MIIGNFDSKAVKMLEHRLKRKQKATERSKCTKLQAKEENIVYILSLSFVLEQILDSSNENGETLFGCKRFEQKKIVISQDFPSSSQMRSKLLNVTLACDKTDVPDTSASILINASLKDMRVITKEDSSKVVDRSKIKRERIQNLIVLKRKMILP